MRIYVRHCTWLFECRKPVVNGSATYYSNIGVKSSNICQGCAEYLCQFRKKKALRYHITCAYCAPFGSFFVFSVSMKLHIFFSTNDF